MGTGFPSGIARLFKKAPRRPWRLWRGVARGASVALALGVGGAAAAQITGAHYEEPTTRYAHGVLGDAVEWGALVIALPSGRVRIRLPADRVFEDVAPRLWDVTGDGNPEVVVVESHLARGARLAIYDNTGLVAATPFIGTPNRWLAPVGAADLDGDGAVEIAYVDRPHLARTLRIWRFRDGALTQVGSASGFTNHRIGWDHIIGGLRDCAGGPELVLASGDWASVMAVRYDGTVQARRLGAYSDAAIAAAMTCQ